MIPGDDFLTPDQMLALIGPSVGGHEIRDFDGWPRSDSWLGTLRPTQCRFHEGRVATTYYWDGWTETWVLDHLLAAAVEAVDAA